MEVKIYTTPTCGYCHQAKAFMDDLGVKYTEYDVSRNREAAEEMVKLTGQMGVPVIVVDGQAVIGFNRPRLEQLFANGNRQRPHLGLKVTDASSIARLPGQPPQLGALVGSVASNSAGARAGIRVGDIITGIGGTRVNNVSELEEAVRSAPAGCIPVTYYRGDKAYKAEIVTA